MKQLKLLGTLAILAIFSVSCSSTVPLHVTGNAMGDKTGTSSNTCILVATGTGLTEANAVTAVGGNMKPTSFGVCFNTDSYGIREAAKNAGIEKVATVDLRTTWYVFWTKFELVVNGQ